MSGYYYLMAQLPALLSGSPLPISYTTFRDTALRFLSARDKVILDQLSLEPPRTPVSTGSRILDRWFARERALRLSLERVRSARLKRDLSFSADDEELINQGFDTVQTARNASALDSPLDAERLLDRSRLSFIEELRGNHYFDSDAVFTYGLMLLLRERSDRFTAEAGRASYTTIYNQILGE